MIYLNIPSTTDDSNGKVYVIEPRHETIVAKFDATDGCGPAGMAIGPDHQILLGCGGKDALIMSDHGNILTTLTGQGGNDEVWFNPGDGHYLLAESNNTVQKQLGIVDSRNAEVDQDIKTGTSSHSVAADPASNQVYVPITAAGGGSATLCSNSPTSGCVAIFGPSGPDDHPVFVSRNRD
jgi:DNA-binding beta-propeller fold protein YncE